MPSSTRPADIVVGVAVPVPGLGLLSYRVPDRDRPPPKGARVTVPLGQRTVLGCVVDPQATTPDLATLRDVVEVLDDEPFLPADVVDLALWVGEYYAAGAGDALAVAMPPSARRAEGGGFRTVTVATLAASQSSAIVGDTPRAGAAKQRAALEHLSKASAGLSLPVLRRLGIGGDVVRRLALRGLVTLSEQIHERDPFALQADGGSGHFSLAVTASPDRPLTTEQQAAFDLLRELADARQFRTALLHGVTGSGKTEIYLRLARYVLEQQRRVLLLVPEIALTPAVAGMFRLAFGERVAIQHSGLSEGERHDQWHRIRRGVVDVVIGTRSAVFAPVANLGLIIVDEEHESSYKQDETPRYHGRDVAVMRGRMTEALVLLGSATPSLESSVNADAGRYTRLRLTRRVLDRPLAAVRIVDMRAEMAQQGAEVALSQPLIEAIGLRRARGEQCLVLLNRRGFATVMFCRQCASSIECPHCSVTLTFHRAARRLRCHYCNYTTSIPRRCGECGGEFLEHSGVGTERLEEELRGHFPEARISRVDRDTVRRRGAIARVLAAVARGDVDILVGTQMIAKGHDFPAVTLVGVVSADVGLGLADFRAAERTFQLLTQVVGRAGRGEVSGEAIIQTLYPDHYSVRAAAAQDYATFFGREIEFRRAMEYPPSVGMINVVIKGKTLEGAMADALDLVTRVRQSGLAARVLGPAPAPVAKIKDEYRAQFFIKGGNRRRMREAIMGALEARPDLRRKTLVDVDPNSVT
ncbi:MAG: primosomal protein N' [Vicinamibacterales bacterium]